MFLISFQDQQSNAGGDVVMSSTSIQREALLHAMEADMKDLKTALILFIDDRHKHTDNRKVVRNGLNGKDPSYAHNWGGLKFRWYLRGLMMPFRLCGRAPHTRTPYPELLFHPSTYAPEALSVS
jgi:hypothetical protein